MTTPRPPRFSNERAVFALVEDAFLDMEAEAAADEAGRDDPGLTYREIFAMMERSALAAAKRGNFRLLADFLRPEPRNPFLKMLRGLGLHLGPEAMDLAAKRLCGEYRAGRGRPKKMSESRRDNSPVYDAADEVPYIEKILRQYYPDERDIRERAIAIAVKRANNWSRSILGMGKKAKRLEYETLRKHLNKPKARRLP